MQLVKAPQREGAGFKISWALKTARELKSTCVSTAIIMHGAEGGEKPQLDLILDQ